MTGQREVLVDHGVQAHTEPLPLVGMLEQRPDGFREVLRAGRLGQEAALAELAVHPEDLADAAGVAGDSADGASPRLEHGQRQSFTPRWHDKQVDLLQSDVPVDPAAELELSLLRRRRGHHARERPVAEDAHACRQETRDLQKDVGRLLMREPPEEADGGLGPLRPRL